jgi:hypothetical protein
MYKTRLVTGLIKDGKRFLDALQRKPFPVVAALWRHIEEDDVWKLVVVSPLADSEGLQNAYLKVVEALDELGDSTELSVGDIIVVRPKSAEFTELQRSVERMRAGSHEHGQVLQDEELGDSYVYCWRPSK